MTSVIFTVSALFAATTVLLYSIVYIVLVLYSANGFNVW